MAILLFQSASGEIKSARKVKSTQAREGVLTDLQ